MASPQDFTLSNLRDNAQAMMQHLEQANKLRNRIIQELVALTGGTPAGLDAFFAEYMLPNSYSTDDIKTLYVELDGLPDSIIPDAARDQIFKLLSCIWETFA